MALPILYKSKDRLTTTAVTGVDPKRVEPHCEILLVSGLDAVWLVGVYDPDNEVSLINYVAGDGVVDDVP